MMMFASYRNHIIYTSVYVALLAYLGKLTLASWEVSSKGPLDVLFSRIASFVLLALLIFWALVAEVQYAWMRRRLPPGDSGLPIVGHVPKIIEGPLFMNQELTAKYGTPFTINTMMTPLVIFCSDEDASWCQSQERKGKLVPFSVPHMGWLLGHDTIFFSHGKHHRRLRKIMEPAFSPKCIQDYFGLVDKTIQAELESWCATDEYLSTEVLALVALKLFLVCGVGHIDEDLVKEMTAYFHDWLAGFVTSIPVAYPGGELDRGIKARMKLETIWKEFLDDFKKKNPHDDNSLLGRLCYGVDDDGKPLTEEQLIQNVLFLLFAGHDTTKGSLGSILHYLSENPDVWEQLRQEVDSYPETLTFQQLKSAPILNAVMAETWRLNPPLNGHQTIVQEPLDYGKYHFPKGSSVAFTYQLQNYLESDRYPDAQRFCVQRWLPPDHKLHDPKFYAKGVDYNVMNSQYRTFGAGPHMCIGAHFAKLETRILITRLVQRYDLSTKNSHRDVFPFLRWLCDFKLTKRTYRN